MSRSRHSTLEKTFKISKAFDDELEIQNNGFQRFEFIPVDTSGEKYKLSVILEEKLFSGIVEMPYQSSEFIEAADLLQVFCGFPNLDKHTSLSFETVVDSNVLKIKVCISFQKDTKKKRRTEEFNFELMEAERDIEQEDTNAIKKNIERLEMERESLYQKLQILEGYYDSRIKTLDMKFYFSASSKITEEYFEITIKIDQEKKDFINCIHKDPRFTNISGHFKKHVYEAKIYFASKELYEKNVDSIQEWIIDFSCPSDIGYCFTHRTPEMMLDYIKKRDASDFCDQRKQIDNILVTLFELNLEYELDDKLILPPSLFSPQIQYMDVRGWDNQLNIMQKLSNLPRFQDETFFHPSIGFFKSDIEKIFSQN